MHDLYATSIALIGANQAPSGAYVASPNFGQYRYCWFRDGAYIAYAMGLIGEYDSAERFYTWATRLIAARAPQVERVVAAVARGADPAPADLLDTRYAVDGAVGTADWPNFQLDGFGTLLWGLAEHLALTGRPLPPAWRPAVTLLTRYLAALWDRPCYDCWEEFGDQVHTATLAALYGGLQAAARLLADPAPAATAAAIRRYVLDQCVVDGRLVKFAGNPAVDGSLVHVSTPYRLLEPDDPRMVATMARVEQELCGGGGVHRYAADTYYGGGAWILLTAYRGWYRLERGDRSGARALRAWIEEHADAAGHLPEQVPVALNDPAMLPVWEARWGPVATPLLWSHAAYLTLDTMLNRAAVAAALAGEGSHADH